MKHRQNSRHLLVGVTGNIGSGKSRLCSILESHGVYRIDADFLARSVVEPGSKGIAAVADKFGEQFIHPDGSLNRPLLGQKIFGDEASRKQLEKLLHPLIREEAIAACEHAVSNAFQFIVYEAALLLEGDHQEFVDRVVVVHAPEEVRLTRVSERDGFDEQSIRERMAAQMSSAEQIMRADLAIENDTDLSKLESACATLLEQMRNWLEEKYA